VYADDIIALWHDTEPMTDASASLYSLKEGSNGEPTLYLGANVGMYQCPDGRECWSMSGRDYVKNTTQTTLFELAKLKPSC
jgi:hypothetical protein